MWCKLLLFLVLLPRKEGIHVLGFKMVAESFVAILDVSQLILGQCQEVATVIDEILVSTDHLVIGRERLGYGLCLFCRLICSQY